MKLKRIYVDDLFGIYKYDLNLANPDLSHVTIIDAPNGMGKTTMLQLVQATLQGDISYIDTIPFSHFGIEFDDEQKINVFKQDIYESVLGRNFYKIRNQLVHDPESYGNTGIKLENISYEINGKKYNISLQRDFVMMLIRRIRMDREIMMNMTLSELIARDDYNYNNEDIFIMEDLINTLNEFSKEFQIYFIKTNRLYRRNDKNKMRDDRYRGRMDSRNDMVSAVELYREKIKSDILAAGKEFADKSEELDRNFPQRVLDIIFKRDQKSNIYSKDQIETNLKELEERRSEFSELGLITESGDTLVKIPDCEELTNETRIFLTKYIEDNVTKLEIYKELSEKLKLLRNIVNDRNVFSDKEMHFNAKEGIEFISKSGRNIPIDKLSSGEKNNFVLFYELIFACGNHSLILVDEPEISLHVAWQRQFIDELNEICKLKELQGIVATHSPDIVGDNVDFMVDLEDMNNEED